MASPGFKTNGLKSECDDIEKSLEVLDKVLSEFEDPDSLPHIVLHNNIEPESPSQGNQSEDDGYMSMNGRRMSPAAETSKTTAPVSLSDILQIDTESNDIIEHHQKLDDSAVIIQNESPAKINIIENNKINDIEIKEKINDEKVNINSNIDAIDNLHATQQTTLPKARQSNIIPSKYSSLPCSGPARYDHRIGRGGGSFDCGTSNLRGIDISAVHDAVLRGGIVKLEPILNEHPVTIYPGRSSSPNKRVPPRTLPGSTERHREVCRNTIAGDIPLKLSADIQADCKNLTEISSVKNQSSIILPFQRIAITKSPSSPLVTVQQHIFQNSFSNNQLLDNNLLNNRQRLSPHKNNSFSDRCYMGDSIGKSNNFDTDDSNEEFSDDSLEHQSEECSLHISLGQGHSLESSLAQGQSLPPPPAPPLVPPPPSLSAPVTPSKRHSIAWEINLDDNISSNFPKNISRESARSKRNSSCGISDGGDSAKGNSGKEKFIVKSKSKLISQHLGRRETGGSLSSLTSTTNNSGGSYSNHNSPSHHKSRAQNKLSSKNRANSMEWPELLSSLENPVCSTEDEAASINSDDIIPSLPKNLTGKETYVIRKGRKERNRLSDIHTSMSSSINSRLSIEGSLLSGNTASQSLLTANSRHSVDFGVSSHSQLSGRSYEDESLSRNTQNSAILAPRSRLSLDLSSPKNESINHHYLISNNGSINGGNNTPNTPYCYNDWKSNGTDANDDCYPDDSNGNEQPNLNINSSCINTNSLNNNNLLTNNSNSTNISNRLLHSPVQSPDNEIPTPRRELAPPIEEDEEQDSESQSKGAPLRQIENNISALLRGDIAVARIGNVQPNLHRRPLGFRPGVHKSESAKEMLLSQAANIFGPLPPSPPISSPEHETEIDAFPPLPPSPPDIVYSDEEERIEQTIGIQPIRMTSKSRYKDSPPVPPHRSSVGGITTNYCSNYHQPSLNTLKSRSMDAGYSKRYAPSGPNGTLPFDVPLTNSSRRRMPSGAFPKRPLQSPREERCIQTSCSLPETPIFARGCDITRTPHRRTQEMSNSNLIGPPIINSSTCISGTKSVPRVNTSNSIAGPSIVGIGNSTYGGVGNSNRLISNKPLTGAEMLRLAGGPARGWYPKQQKQRTMRSASTEHIERLHRSQGSIRAWDGGGLNPNNTNGRKPLTLPPNLTPKFFNKSPREALRRVTSLLIKKGTSKDKESKHHRESGSNSSVHRSQAGDITINNIYISSDNNGGTSTSSKNSNEHNNQKKKGFFKYFFKRSKHYSIDQQ